MLVKHVRDANGVPFATIVAVDRDKFGCSICSTKDVFRKELGIKIAQGRANYGTLGKVPQQHVLYTLDGVTDFYPVYNVLEHEFDIMQNRAARYFK